MTLILATTLAAVTGARGQSPATAGDVIAGYGVSTQFDTRVWCQEVFAFMDETGTTEAVLGSTNEEQTRSILAWVQARIDEEVTAASIPAEVLRAFRKQQRDIIAGQFATFLETRNPDDLTVLPGYCYTIDFDPTTLFGEEPGPAQVEADWQLNLWCRAAMRHMTREKLFESYSDRQRGQKVFHLANNALKAAAETRGLASEAFESVLKQAEADVAREYESYWPDRKSQLTHGMGPCLSIGYGDGTEPEVEPYEVTTIDLWCYGALIRDRIAGNLDEAGQGRAARALRVTHDRLLGDHVFKGGTPLQVGVLVDSFTVAVGRQFDDPTADLARLGDLTESCYRRAVAPGERVHDPEVQLRYWCVIALRSAARGGAIPDPTGRERAEKTSDGIAAWLATEYDEQGYGIVERTEFQNAISQAAQPQFQRYLQTGDDRVLPNRLADCFRFAP